MTADWNLVQVLGDKPVSELVDGDVDSAVEFDQSGDYLATGDRGGRVRIYEKLSGSAAVGALAPSGAAKGEDGTEYRLWLSIAFASLGIYFGQKYIPRYPSYTRYTSVHTF
jgi:hypothetical protein